MKNILRTKRQSNFNNQEDNNIIKKLKIDRPKIINNANNKNKNYDK